jgi:hypothetical protein
MEKFAPKFADLAKATIVALIGSLIVVMPIASTEARATVITHNDGICDLALISGVYEIDTPAELWEVTDCVSTPDQVFELKDDIVLSNAMDAPTNSPIGLSTSQVVATFSGVLKGNHYEIKGLEMSRSAGVGLFAALQNAEIQNLSLSGIVTQSAIATNLASGALALVSAGGVTISNVTNYVSVFGYQNVGGLIGKNSSGPIFLQGTNHGLIQGYQYVGGFLGQTVNQKLVSVNASNLGVVRATQDVSGGLVGSANGGAASLDIRGFVNRGDITAQAAGWVGGIAGVAYGTATISGSVNHGNVNGAGVAGGLFGWLQFGATITGSLNFGAVTAPGSAVGGLVGRISGSRNFLISSSSNSGTISGVSEVGGILGVTAQSGNSWLTIEQTYNFGTVTNATQATQATSNFFGGLVGYTAPSIRVTVLDSQNKALVSASSKVGGLIGNAAGPLEISNSENHGQIKAASHDVGGLIGAVSGSALLKVRNSGEVSAGIQGAGGIIGVVTAQTFVTLSQAVNSGPVTAGTMSGGLVATMGLNGRLNIDNSLNSGAVSAVTARASGFLGNGSASSSMAVSNSLQVGSVTAPSQTDSFAVNINRVVILSSYTKISSSWSGTSTDVELSTRATFVDWDFDTIWGFPTCVNQRSFPTLRFLDQAVQLGTTSNCTFNSSNSGNQGTSSGSGSSAQPTPAPTPETPTYRGPTLQPLTEEVLAGAQITFEGTKLDSLNRAIVSSLELVIVSKTSTSLVVVLPATLASGQYEIDVYSEFGRLTLLSAFTIKSAPPAPDPDPGPTASLQAELIGWIWSLKFDGNSRVPKRGQEQALDANLAPFANAKTVVCWGYTTSLKPNEWAIAHATARAQALCDLVSAKMSVKTAVRLSYGAPRPHALRASLQFWR